MKKFLWAIPAVMVGASAALAGASSENRIGDKALEGPGGEGAHSTDPNVERSGTPGPKGPGGAEQQAPASKFNDYGTGTAGEAGSGANSNSSGSGATMDDDAGAGTDSSDKMQDSAR